MKIYGMPLSFPVNRTRMTANYLGYDYEFLPVNLMKGEQRSEAFLAKNPVGRVPVLDDDGFILCESGAICKYLATKAGSDIYPGDLQGQAIVNQWIDFVTHHIGNGVGKVLFNRVLAPNAGLDVDEQSLRDGEKFLGRFLPVVDEQIALHGNVAGQAFSLADIILLATIDPCEPGGVELSGYTALSSWRDRLKEQTFYTACHSDFQEIVDGFIRKARGG
jgi:glutathione S-transferase